TSQKPSYVEDVVEASAPTMSMTLARPLRVQTGQVSPNDQPVVALFQPDVRSSIATKTIHAFDGVSDDEPVTRNCRIAMRHYFNVFLVERNRSILSLRGSSIALGNTLAYFGHKAAFAADLA